MKAITKYIAPDGKEFDNQKNCQEYEDLIEEVNGIMNLLPKTPDTTDFTNGKGYIQHNASILLSIKRNLLELMKKHIDHKWIQQTIDNENVDPSWVGRLVSDYGIAPFEKAWYRFQCIDKQQREWGQPYFALHPEQASGKFCIEQ